MKASRVTRFRTVALLHCQRRGRSADRCPVISSTLPAASGLKARTVPQLPNFEDSLSGQAFCRQSAERTLPPGIVENHRNTKDVERVYGSRGAGMVRTSCAAVTASHRGSLKPGNLCATAGLSYSVMQARLHCWTSQAVALIVNGRPVLAFPRCPP